MAMITSGYNFEGYRITNYCGFCTGECVLGTGFLSSLESEVADFLGKNSSTYESKLEAARANALNKLSEYAFQIGGNAIIGVDIDYTIFSRDVIAVIANGTVVTIEQIDPDICKAPKKQNRLLYISNYNLTTPIRMVSLCIECVEQQVQVSLNFINYKNINIDAIKIELTMESIFGDVIDTIILDANNFKIKDKSYATSLFYIDISPAIAQNIHYAYVKILKYFSDDCIYIVNDESFAYKIDKNLKEQFGDDAVSVYDENIDCWICPCGNNNMVDETYCSLCGRDKTTLGERNDLEVIIEKLKVFNTVMEIQKQVDITNIFENSPYEFQIMKKLNESVLIERMYGNQYNSFIKFLTDIEN